LVNIDFGAILQNNENININSKNSTLINHVHISEPYLEVIKEHPLHLTLKDLLLKIDYQKYISIEMSKQDLATIFSSIEYVKNTFE